MGMANAANAPSTLQASCVSACSNPVLVTDTKDTGYHRDKVPVVHDDKVWSADSQPPRGVGVGGGGVGGGVNGPDRSI